MRLNRFLSLCGLGSRRGCEALVTEGRVWVNNVVCKNLGTQVTATDKILVDGQPVSAERSVVIVMNKPRGYLCSRGDTHSRTTIYDLLPTEFKTLHHVGRLDKESEGLLLLTNRGELSHKLVHPSHGVEKEYEVILDKPVDMPTLAKMVKGMHTEEGFAKAERVWPSTDRRVNVILKQGLKRQIRLMFYQLGFEVEKLTRTRIGWMTIKGLPVGGWRELSQAEADRFLAKEKPVIRKTSAKPKGLTKPASSDTRPARSLRSETSGRPSRSNRSMSEDRPRRSSRSQDSDSRPSRSRDRDRETSDDRPRRSSRSQDSDSRPSRSHDRDREASDDRPRRRSRSQDSETRPTRVPGAFGRKAAEKSSSAKPRRAGKTAPRGKSPASRPSTRRPAPSERRDRKSR